MNNLKKILAAVSIVAITIIGTSLTLSSDNDLLTEPTGIYLDTLENEVFLAMNNDLPSYFCSNIFTPVCETGVCKPIYINLYWDLNGNYLTFDFPEDEILTKLDHVPFTEEDYLLLDEILRGADPRTGIAEAKYSPSEGAGSEESSPAPASPKIVMKIDMVDGVTGSTLPQHKDKFVPGALYTTYTIWDLANSHRSEMFEYFQSLDK